MWKAKWKQDASHCRWISPLTLLPLPSLLVDEIWPPRVRAALSGTDCVDGALVVLLEENAGLKREMLQRDVAERGHTAPSGGSQRDETMAATIRKGGPTRTEPQCLPLRTPLVRTSSACRGKILTFHCTPFTA